MQKAAFQAELNQKRLAWLFEKEKDGYNDRRRHTLDGNTAKAANDQSNELFRREAYLSQSNYDRNVHAAARTHLEQKYGGSRNVAYQVEDYGKDGDREVDADNAHTGDRDNDPVEDEGRDGNDADARRAASGERPSFNPFP